MKYGNLKHRYFKKTYVIRLIYNIVIVLYVCISNLI